LQQQLLIGSSSSSSNGRSRANSNVIKWHHKQHNLNTLASVNPAHTAALHVAAAWPALKCLLFQSERCYVFHVANAG
jgi:hypothetical protein